MLVLGGGRQGRQRLRHVARPARRRAWTSSDLHVTTDYRSVLSEVVRTRFTGVSLPKLFPAFRPEKVGVMVGG